MINLANEPVRSVPKSSQLHHDRQKPSRASISNLSPKETKRLYERSGGVCEKCDRQRGAHRAHIERRQNHTVKPVAEDFVHLCSGCHAWCDGSREGREWLLQFQQKLLREGA